MKLCRNIHRSATDTDFFGLSRSTRCGCCSYQVSSIFVRSYDASWSLMKEIKKILKSPFFYFHGNCGKVCPTNSDFFGLSRSTRCNFMKLCRNIHRSVWQLLGVDKIQNGGHCHGNQGANMLNSLQTSQFLIQIFLNPPFFVSWQLRQSLSNRFRFVWLISFH
jgi:hypothetical protein